MLSAHKQLSSHKHFNEEVSHDCAGYLEKNASLSSTYPGLSPMRGRWGSKWLTANSFICVFSWVQTSLPRATSGRKVWARPPHCQNPTTFPGQGKSTSNKSHNSSQRQITTFLTKGRRQEHWAAGKSSGWSWKHVLVSHEELLQTCVCTNSCLTLFKKEGIRTKRPQTKQDTGTRQQFGQEM